jgi:hypothetical protein
VIDYPSDKLVLTAMRNNVTGEYVTYDELVKIGYDYDVPVVEAFRKQANDLNSFIKYVRGIKNMEGYVIRFASGHMTKLKGDEYCFIHNTKEIMAKEKDVLQLVVEGKVDDVLPTLDEADRDSLIKFEELFHKNIQKTANDIKAEVEGLRAQYPTKKDFFMHHVKNLPKEEQVFHLRAYDNQDVVESLMHKIKLHMHSGPRVAEVRKYWGDVNWIDFRQPMMANQSMKAKMKRLWLKAVDKFRLFTLVK